MSLKAALLLSACALSLQPCFATQSAEGASPYISYDAAAQARRDAYKAAKDAAFAGDAAAVEKYQQGALKGYPLNIYLDYYLLRANVSNANYRKALRFVQGSGDQELSLLLSDAYTPVLASEGRYRQVREMYGFKAPYGMSEPADLKKNEKERQCRWYEAELSTGNGGSRAVSFASELYASKDGYPDGCSGLIAVWSGKGYLSKAAASRRFASLYTSRRDYSGSAQSAAGALSEPYQQAAFEAMSVYDTPEKYDTLSSPEAAALAFRRYAAKNPNDARAALEAFEAKYHPDAVQRREIVRTIAYGLLGRTSGKAELKWVDDNLPIDAMGADLTEKRLRRAVWFREWKKIPELIDALGESASEEANWRYWKGRALLNTGKKQEGRELLRLAANDRSFFGFFAAQTLGIHPRYNNSSLKRTTPLSPQVLSAPALQRFFELYAMEDPAQAIEWREIARHADETTALTACEWALRSGNDQLAIQAVAQGKRWDALDYRFPLSFINLYRAHAQKTGVKLAYLYGISRQESMLNPVVRSPAGAVGLMQLMPGTAQVLSRKNGWRYGGVASLKDPDTNIRYGSTYLKQLLGQFGGNRILASAGYNAGPGRAQAWISHDGGHHDAAMYVENIPFDETRGYVQRVLLYTAIYEKLLTGRDVPVLTDYERDFRY